MKTLAAVLLLLVFAPAARGATWERLAEGGPAARSEHALATARGAVYLHGGRTESGRVLDDLWRLDPAAGRWERLRPRGAKPSARFGQNLAAGSRGRLLLFGGQAGTRFFAGTWRYDPAANRWRRLASGGPAPRYGAAGGYDRRSGRLVVSHGFTSSGRFDDTWRLGASAREISGRGRRPLRRCLVQGTVASRGFLLFGGQSDARPFHGDLWRLDLETRRWRRLGGPAPSARNLYAAAKAGGGWFVHGGNTADGLAGDVWRLDLSERRFAPVAVEGTAPPRRAGHAAARVPGGLVIFGGDGAGGSLADTWRLSL